MNYYVSRFWLAISVSFYLFIPYLSRYIDENNRFGFHWTRLDLFSLLFCIVLVGTLFFICFILLYVRGRKITRKIFEFFYIATLGVALIANISHLVKYSAENPPTYIITLGILVWILLGCIALWAVLYNRRIKMLCIALCFIASPIIPLFTLNALRYESFTSDRGSVPTLSATENQKLDGKGNVYIFIFDEWSYQRSFNHKELIKEFKNLKQFKESALVFHQAYSPAPITIKSIPSFLFQTNLPFKVKEHPMGFRGKQYYPLNRMETIFHHARQLGFYTAMIGAAMPYGEMLGDSVDFCKAICTGKRFGHSFLGVSKHHMLTALLSLPGPFFNHEIKNITHYFRNRFQVNGVNTTHELFNAIVQNQPQPTFAVFHYMIPHYPYIFNREGHKELFAVYDYKKISNYYDNLAYLDEKIGEIISTLKESNRFDNSLIIMTSDHSLRYDPVYDNTVCLWVFGKERTHIPLFIKMPYQKRSIEIDSEFNTFKLGCFINKYLDGDFTLSEIKFLLGKKDYFTPALLEVKETEYINFSKEIDITTCKMRGRR